MKCLVLVVLIAGAVKGDEVQEDQLEVGGSFWQKLGNQEVDDSERQKLSLQQFLETYAKKHNKKPVYYDVTTEASLDKLVQKDKSKSQWTLLDMQKHKHPFDDRKGWVSLEPIPWSLSKISKWQSKYKPSSDRPWDENGPISSSHRPYIDEELEYNRPVSITPPNPYVYRPTESSDRYDVYHYQEDRPRPTVSYPRPTAYFGHKVHLDTKYPSSSYHSNDCNNPQHHHQPEIITDGLPSNFPSPNPYDTFRRRGSEMEIHSETHPFNGEGEWVLLSTTKGYKPSKSRDGKGMQEQSSEPNVVRASRGVRLTVLPPLKGNMTTSHGGILQVASTSESVEQSKEKFDRKQKKRRRRKKKADEVPQLNDPGAVMAAVGAGLIPATMAMMVPLVG